jgi:hypothetical protein
MSCGTRSHDARRTHRWRSSELAGHVDVRATQIYVDVTDQRKADGIARARTTAAPAC